MSDLGHAIILLVHFHSLCSFVYACNLNDEIPRAVKVSSVYCRRNIKCFTGMFLLQQIKFDRSSNNVATMFITNYICQYFTI